MVIPDRDQVDSLLERKGATQAEMARHLGIYESAMTNLLKGTRQARIGEVVKMAEFLAVTVTKVLTILGVDADSWRPALFVGGYVEADEVDLVDDADPVNLEEVRSPFPGYEGTVLRVRGNRMAPRYRDGDLVAFRREIDGREDCLGTDAIIETDKGAVLLKVLQPGSGPDCYVLVSNDPSVPPLVNVRIKAAHPIDWIKPAKAR